MNDSTPLLTRRDQSIEKTSPLKTNTSRSPNYKEERTLAKQITREILYDGSSKTLYQTDRSEFLTMEFKGGTAEVKKKGKTKSLASIKNEMSSYLFEYLEGFHIPTHFVNPLSETEMTIKRLEIIPIIVRVFNIALGSIPKRFGVKEGTPLTFPIIEHFYKNEDLGFPWLNEFHVYAFNLATPDEFRLLNRLASKVNAVLRALCERRDLILASASLEFGRYKGQILLGDELSPSTCVFWDKLNKTKAGRDTYRTDRPNAEEALTELSNLIQRKG